MDVKTNQEEIFASARRIYEFVKEELDKLDNVPMGWLLHLVIMSWADDYIKIGILTKTEPQYELICKGTAYLQAKIDMTIKKNGGIS